MPWTVRLGSLVVLLASAAGAEVPEGPARADRWLEVRVSTAATASAERLERLERLGWELKEREDGAWSVFLPAAELGELSAAGLPFDVVHDDLERFYASRLIDPARARIAGFGSMGGYYTWDEAVGRMDELVSAWPGLLAPKVSLARTHEGRDIWAWKLSASVEREESEPALVVMALMHAREPAGLMSVISLAEHLVEGYGSDPEATWLLDHRELWLIPVLNPDGYVYNQTRQPGGGGMWRKNRRDNGGGAFGVDPNRNFAWEWAHDDVGSSANVGDDTYRGPAPLSEPETALLRDLVIAQRPALSINTHTFSDVLIRPWGYLDAACADDAALEDVSRLATRATAYNPGNVRQTLGYLANGSHDDYMWGETGAKPRVFGLTPELGNGNDGFWPATARIEPIRREALPQFLALVWAAGAAPRLAGLVADDSAPGGDGDGWLEPGETLRLTVTVRNRGLGETWGPVSARLSGVACELLVEDGESDLGSLATQSAGSNGADPFLVRVASGATPGTLARLELRLTDAGGEYPPMPLALLLGEPVTVFADELESGTGKWSLTGFGVEAAGMGRAGQALSDSPGGSYGTGADAVAAPLGAFDLKGFARAWLVFEQRFWIDNDFDAAALEVWDGSSWRAVAGETTDVGSGVGAQTGGEPLWDGRLAEWATERVDLSGVAGPGAAPMSFRFRLRSDGSIGYDGWHVDGVRLLGFAPVTPPRAPGDPVRLLAARSGADLWLEWTAAPADPGHDPADSYVVWTAPGVRADRGFAPLSSTLAPSAVQAGAASDAGSRAYVVSAANCAGSSPEPPR